MELSFTLQHTNLLIALVSLVIIFYLLSKKFSKRRAIRFGNFETLKKVAGKNLLTYSIIPIALRILALALIILAISDPTVTALSPSSNTDYVLAIDTSSSMLTPDIPPNRLDATKSTVLEFVKENGVSNFGVVTFSGEAKIHSELVNDRQAIMETVRQIGIEESAGTAIGEAVVVSSVLLSDSKKDKAIILITDGRTNRGIDINKTYDTLKEKNIRVFSLGLGKTYNETIEVPEGLEGLNATHSEFPSVDEKELMIIANVSSGEYFRVENVRDLNSAIKKAIFLESQVVDLQMYLLLLACGVLLLGWALEMTKYRVIP
ncbi:MAG: vWA domain-containing protein [Candidatus Aenigmatarchaeota archaeon]